MTRAEITRSVLELPVDEQLELVDSIWEHLDESAIPLHDWQKSILDERLDAERQAPEVGASWSTGIRVLAVLHLASDPKHWRRRL